MEKENIKLLNLLSVVLIAIVGLVFVWHINRETGAIDKQGFRINLAPIHKHTESVGIKIAKQDSIFIINNHVFYVD